MDVVKLLRRDVVGVVARWMDPSLRFDKNEDAGTFAANAVDTGSET